MSRGWEAGVKALDREAASAAADGLDSGRASATLLLSGECHFGSGLHAHTKSLTDLMDRGGLLRDGLCRLRLLDRGRVGHIAAEFMTQRCRVIRENLRVVCAARNGHVGHAAVEQVFCTQLGVHMDQYAVGGLALAGVTGDSVAVIEMHAAVWIEFDGAATVHPHINASVAADGLDDAKFSVCHFGSLAGAVARHERERNVSSARPFDTWIYSFSSSDYGC
jgi:hypothetical protein